MKHIQDQNKKDVRFCSLIITTLKYMGVFDYIKPDFIRLGAVVDGVMLGHGLKYNSQLKVIEEGLPLKNWWPFDASISPAYELTYAYQKVVSKKGITSLRVDERMFSIVRDESETDSREKMHALKQTRSGLQLFIPGSLVPSGLLQPPTSQLSAVLSNSRVSKEHEDTEGRGSEQDLKEEIHTQIREDMDLFIKYHQELFRACGQLDTLIHPIIGADLLVTLVVFCACGFQLSL
ncbi:unnamed protein product, partial [Timema podura]|nr:unnamed protein product [Timema podura]